MSGEEVVKAHGWQSVGNWKKATNKRSLLCFVLLIFLVFLTLLFSKLFWKRAESTTELTFAERWNSVTSGMTKTEVLAIMGPANEVLAPGDMKFGDPKTASALYWRRGNNHGCAQFDADDVLIVKDPFRIRPLEPITEQPWIEKLFQNYDSGPINK